MTSTLAIMDARRRRELKRQGKAEVELRSAQRKARADALLPDMMAAAVPQRHTAARPKPST
ncbi:hypothetical protein FDZ73_21060 [bacterium]|nr:MAG: hypothetical protein FDZ73_21060 [bacterium]